jgi:hypothetical protein
MTVFDEKTEPGYFVTIESVTFSPWRSYLAYYG